MEDVDDPYEILGVSKDANRSQIRAAYRKAALRHHPDKQQTSSEQEKQRANVLFAKIPWIRAVKSLSDKATVLLNKRVYPLLSLPYGP